MSYIHVHACTYAMGRGAPWSPHVPRLYLEGIREEEEEEEEDGKGRHRKGLR